MDTVPLRVLHYNDVYHIGERKREPVGGVARFSALVRSMKADGEGNPLVLFSGDALSPSALSMVTRGAHMISALNVLGTAAAALGNHDLDDGLENFQKRSAESAFPWLATNVDYRPHQAAAAKPTGTEATEAAAAEALQALAATGDSASASPAPAAAAATATAAAAVGGLTEDEHEADEVDGAPREHGMVRTLTRMTSSISRSAGDTDAVDDETLPGCKRFAVIEHEGVTVGLLGLIEDSWLETLSSVDPRDLQYEDFTESARWWSRRLREDHQCDIVIALTHMRLPRDVQLGRLAHAIGVDLVLGGHDHFYSTQEVLPVDSVEAAAAGLDDIKPAPDTSGSGPSVPGACLVAKSGTDFRNLTDIRLTVRPAAPLDEASETGRGGVVAFAWEQKEVTGALEPSADDLALVERLSASMAAAAGQVLGHVHAPLDGRFSSVRGGESNLGNWVCEIMRRTARTDCALINGGTLRSDLVHPAGKFTMADLLKISPYPSEVPTVRVSGRAILEALENGVSKYPEGEGRFPQVAGIRFAFNADAEPMSRIDPAMVLVGHCREALAPLDLEGRYTVATTDYLSLGKDGFESLSPITDRGKELGSEWVVDLSRAPVLPTLIRAHIEMVEAINSEQRRFADVGVERWRSRLLRLAGKRARGSLVSPGPRLSPGAAEEAAGAASSGEDTPMTVNSDAGSAGAASTRGRHRFQSSSGAGRDDAEGGHEDTAASGAQAAASFLAKQQQDDDGGAIATSSSLRKDADMPAPRLTRMQSAPTARGPSMLPELQSRAKKAGDGEAKAPEPLVEIAPQLDGRIAILARATS